MRQRIVGLFFYLVGLFLTLTFAACGTTTPHAASPAGPAWRHTASPTALASRTVLPASTPSTNKIGIPVRLVIPAIGINAPVESVGLQQNGDMGIPTKSPWEDAGWYNLGPRPGEWGSAVIDGHLDRPGALPAVFWYLRNLHAGDVVMVIDAQGKRLHFHVTDVMSYPAKTAPYQQIFGDQGGTYLNLITCAGDWIPEQHQTTSRLVVYTSLDR